MGRDTQNRIVPQGEQSADVEYVVLGQRLMHEQRAKSGARWFYWIAGLSIVNSVASSLGVTGRLFFGLGVTQVTDAFGVVLAESLSGTINLAFKVVSLIVTIVAAAVFVVFGLFASRYRKWAFIAGMVLYAADALVFLWVEDYLSIGLHLFVLLVLFQGLKALGELRDLDEAALEYGRVKNSTA